MGKGFGKTGNFPNGKMNEHDEGELRYGVAADPEAGVVVLNFGTPVAALGLPPQNAIELGMALIKKAQTLAPIVVEVPIGSPINHTDG